MKGKKMDFAIYLGEFVTRTENDVWQHFRTRAGEVVNFKGIRGIFLGDVVKFDVAQGKMSRRPERLSEEDARIAGLVLTRAEELRAAANREIVRTFRNRRKKARAIAEMHPEVRRAVEILRPFTEGMDFFEMDGFTQSLRNELSKRGKR